MSDPSITAGSSCKRTLFKQNSKQEQKLYNVKSQRCSFRVEGAVSSQEGVVLEENTDVRRWLTL